MEISNEDVYLKFRRSKKQDARPRERNVAVILHMFIILDG